ncbi:MAG: hypothetical protein EBZ78_09115, partial [Verrucomicrobia bacterium]|nr:hypothetical protein [Verrucomicrobiota bacterium]
MERRSLLRTSCIFCVFGFLVLLVLGKQPCLAITRLTISSGILNLSEDTEVGSLEGTGSIRLGQFSLTTGIDNTDAIFGGSISGLGGLIKVGTGNMTLTGTNSFLGDAVLSGGQITIESSAAFDRSIFLDVRTNTVLMVRTNILVGSLETAGTITQLGNAQIRAAQTVTSQGEINAVIADFAGDSNFPAFQAGLLKRNAGTTVIGATNTFTGDVKVTGGILKLGAAGSFDPRSSLILQGTNSTLDLNGKTQEFSRINAIKGRVVLGSGNLVVGGTNLSEFGAVISGSGGFMQEGSGHTVLNASNTFTGTMQINEGKVDFGTNGSVRPSTIYLGYDADDRGIMTVRDGNTLTMSSARGVVIGYNGSGAVYQSGGTINVTGETSWENFALGYNNGSYGYYNLSAGNVILKEVGVGSAGGNGTGMLDVTGGTLTADDFLFLTRGNASQKAVMNITGGAVYGSDLKLVMDPVFSFNNSSGKLSSVTVSSNGLFSFKNNGFDMNRGGTGNVGVINLNNGGVMESRRIYASTAGSSTYLNFNGGVIKSTLGGSTDIISGLTRATVNSGGAIFDTAGYDVNMSQALQDATGKGVVSIAVVDGGDGYIGPPVVQISGGGGTGATARAIVDKDTGKVTAIEITNPGWGYTNTPTVTLSQGGFTRAATLGAAAIADLTPGGLRKIGFGKLNLTGVSAYTGGTVVEAGTLEVGGGTPGGIGSIRGELTVRPNATLLSSGGWGLGQTPINSVDQIVLDGGSLDFHGSSAGNNGLAATGLVMINGATISGGAFDWYASLPFPPCLTAGTNDYNFFGQWCPAMIRSGINLRLGSDTNRLIFDVAKNAPVGAPAYLHGVVVNFERTNTSKTYTVPAGVSGLSFRLTGAAGGKGGNDANLGSPGGLAGEVRGYMAVQPGDVLRFYLGSAGGGGGSGVTGFGGGIGGDDDG